MEVRRIATYPSTTSGQAKWRPVDSRPNLQPEAIPLHLLPLVKWLRNEPKDGLCFIERGGLLARQAFESVATALGVQQLPLTSSFIRRFSQTYNHAGVVLRQLLSAIEITRRIAQPKVSAIARACRNGDTRDSILSLTSPNLCDLLDVITERDPPAVVTRLQVVHQLFIKPTGPVAIAAAISVSNSCEEVLRALRSDARLARHRRTFTQGLQRSQLSEDEVRRRLAGRAADAESLADAFTDIFGDGFERCRFTEEEALRAALTGSTIERTFAGDHLFVDDRIASGETYVVLAMLYALYHADVKPSLYVLGADYPLAVRGWCIPLKVASSTAVVFEDLPQYVDSVWEWRDGRYWNVPYSARGGTCSDTATKWRRDFVLRVLEEARLQCTTPEVFERLSETTKLRLVESAMLERCADRYSNFWQASCADLLHDAVGLVPSRRERSVMAISDDLSRSYNWLRRAARGLAACDLERFAMIIASECCQSWAKKHDQFRTQQVNAAAAWIAHSRHRPTICSYLERGNGMHNICCDDDSEFAALVAYADRSSTNGVSASSLDSLLERRLP